MLAPFFLNAQIWQETFNGLANGATLDVGTTAWSTLSPSGGGASFSKQNPVTGYELFMVNNTGAGSEGVWTSQSINIAAYTEVALEIALYSYYTFSTDYIRCYYKINGGEEILFGELLGSNGLSITSAASAIVSGNTVQIVIRAMDNTPGTNSDLGVTVQNAMAFDNVTLTSISVLYSISSGNWSNNTTWSRDGFAGASCATCVPSASHRVIIGNGKTVSIPAAATAAGIIIENTGRLQYTGNSALTIARGGTVEIQEGGIMARNGNNTSSLVCNAYAYDLIIEGEFSVGTIDANPGATITLSGGGMLDVAGDFYIGSGRTITNNVTGGLTIGDEMIFEGTSSSAAFVNNGVLTVNNRILFNASNVTFTNNGTVSANATGLAFNDAADDGNVLINAAGKFFNVSTINGNGADFILNNSGVITQTGNFSNISAASRFYNLDGATWNFSGGGTNTRLFCNNGINTFNYNASTAQTINIPADGAYSNLTLSGSGAKSASGNLSINGTLSVQGTARLDVTASSHTINLKGDWIVTGTNADPFEQRTGTVLFNGAADQNISTTLSTGETFYNLAISKTSGNVIMSGSTDMTVTGTLTLTAGGLDLNSKVLNISNASVNAITRTNGFIKSENTSAPYGQVKWIVGTAIGTYVFPFGKTSAAADYIPFTFQVTSAGTGATGTVSLSTYATPASNLPLPSGVTNVYSAPGRDNSANTADRFWYITLNGYTVNPVTTVTFVASSDEVGSISFLKAQRWNSVTTKWDAPITGQTNPTPYSVQVPGVSNFSPWTLSGNNIVLPVELFSFEASLENGVVDLEWITAQETNNDFFTLEKSRDFESFYPVTRIRAAGTSKMKHAYKAIDHDPYSGTSYYRLKQTDFDGSTTYFKPVKVEFSANDTPVIDVFPVPCDGNWIEVSITGLEESENIPVAVFNAQGKAVYRTILENTHGEASRKVIFNNSLAPGVYTIQAGRLLNMRRKIVVE